MCQAVALGLGQAALAELAEKALDGGVQAVEHVVGAPQPPASRRSSRRSSRASPGAGPRPRRPSARPRAPRWRAPPRASRGRPGRDSAACRSSGRAGPAAPARAGGPRRQRQDERRASADVEQQVEGHGEPAGVRRRAGERPGELGRKGKRQHAAQEAVGEIGDGEAERFPIAEVAARSGLRALPRLAPSTMASAASGVTSPAPATAAMTRTVAMLECIAQVSSAVATRTGSGSRVAHGDQLAGLGPTAPGAKVSTRRCRARRIRPRPIPARPRLRVRARLPARKATRPAKIRPGRPG